MSPDTTIIAAKPMRQRTPAVLILVVESDLVVPIVPLAIIDWVGTKSLDKAKAKARTRFVSRKTEGTLHWWFGMRIGYMMACR